jgi:hypothetical protein
MAVFGAFWRHFDAYLAHFGSIWRVFEARPKFAHGQRHFVGEFQLLSIDRGAEILRK